MNDASHATTPRGASIALEELKQRVMGMPMAQTLGLRFLDVQVGSTVMEMPYSYRLSFAPGLL
jgi:acyl-coenzyme A thioesterase PaaI-like protein